MSVSLDLERETLAGLAAGRREATEAIYRRHSSTIIGWVCANGGAEPDGDDVLQEALVVLFQKAQDESFRLTCRIGTYLFAVARHIWLKRLEKRSRGPVALADDAGADESADRAYEDDLRAHHERELHYEALDAALDQLGEPCRGLLRAFYHEGKSMADIAAAAGYTGTDTAKTQKYKCLARLKKIFFRSTGQ